MSDTPKEYLARIGAKGGKKSRRKLSTQEASQTACARWGKPKKEKPAPKPKPKAKPQPSQPTMSESEAAILARLNNHQLRTK